MKKLGKLGYRPKSKDARIKKVFRALKGNCSAVARRIGMSVAGVNNAVHRLGLVRSK